MWRIRFDSWKKIMNTIYYKSYCCRHVKSSSVISRFLVGIQLGLIHSTGDEMHPSRVGRRRVPGSPGCPRASKSKPSGLIDASSSIPSSNRQCRCFLVGFRPGFILFLFLFWVGAAYPLRVHRVRWAFYVNLLTTI